MSAVSESNAQRMTLADIVEWYGCEIVPAFASPVTVTSLADSVDCVVPGALFVCRDVRQLHDLPQAVQSGAYAVLVDRSLYGQCPALDIPVMFGSVNDHMIGDLACRLVGNPAATLAVFAVTGQDRRQVDADVDQLAQFLHMLGNPVAQISASGSICMTRTLNIDYPMGILDIQRTLAICAEEGVAAVIIAMEAATLAPHALESVAVDVIGARRDTAERDIDGWKNRYGFIIDRQHHMVCADAGSDALAAEAVGVTDRDHKDRLSFAIAMVMAAGVRRNSVRSALRMADSLAR